MRFLKFLTVLVLCPFVTHASSLTSNQFEGSPGISFDSVSLTVFDKSWGSNLRGKFRGLKIDGVLYHGHGKPNFDFMISSDGTDPELSLTSAGSSGDYHPLRSVDSLLRDGEAFGDFGIERESSGRERIITPRAITPGQLLSRVDPSEAQFISYVMANAELMINDAVVRAQNEIPTQIKQQWRQVAPSFAQTWWPEFGKSDRIAFSSDLNPMSFVGYPAVKFDSVSVRLNKKPGRDYSNVYVSFQGLTINDELYLGHGEPFISFDTDDDRPRYALSLESPGTTGKLTPLVDIEAMLGHGQKFGDSGIKIDPSGVQRLLTGPPHTGMTPAQLMSRVSTVEALFISYLMSNSNKLIRSAVASAPSSIDQRTVRQWNDLAWVFTDKWWPEFSNRRLVSLARVAANEQKHAKVKADQKKEQAKQKERLAAAKAKAEADLAAKEQAELEAKIRAELKAEMEAEAKARAEAERLAAEEKAQAEEERLAAAKAQAEADLAAKEKAELGAKIRAELKAEMEAEAKAKAEAERLAAEKKAQEEQAKLEAKIRAELKAEMEAESNDKEETGLLDGLVAGVSGLFADDPAELKRKAEEAEAKAEQERLLAEKKARMARERAEAAKAKEEAERLAVEKKAQAEKERLAAEKKAREEDERTEAVRAEKKEIAIDDLTALMTCGFIYGVAAEAHPNDKSASQWLEHIREIGSAGEQLVNWATNSQPSIDPGFVDTSAERLQTYIEAFVETLETLETASPVILALHLKGCDDSYPKKAEKYGSGLDASTEPKAEKTKAQVEEAYDCYLVMGAFAEAELSGDRRLIGINRKVFGAQSPRQLSNASRELFLAEPNKYTYNLTEARSTIRFMVTDVIRWAVVPYDEVLREPLIQFITDRMGSCAAKAKAHINSDAKRAQDLPKKIPVTQIAKPKLIDQVGYFLACFTYYELNDKEGTLSSKGARYMSEIEKILVGTVPMLTSAEYDVAGARQMKILSGLSSVEKMNVFGGACMLEAEIFTTKYLL